VQQAQQQGLRVPTALHRRLRSDQVSVTGQALHLRWGMRRQVPEPPLHPLDLAPVPGSLPPEFLRVRRLTDMCG
jgi:hypothetical protein